MIIAGEDLKKGSKIWYSNCGYNCELEFAFNALENKKSITMICPICGGETTIKHMANGKINKKWKSKK